MMTRIVERQERIVAITFSDDGELCFLTSGDRFVDREEGMRVAVAAGQALGPRFTADLFATIVRPDGIETAIRTMSFPAGWELRRIEWVGYQHVYQSVYAEWWPPQGDKAWMDGAALGRGATIDEALRDAQKLVWERWEKYKP